MLLFTIAILLAVLISWILAEAEVASPVPLYSPVIPPEFKVHLKRLVHRVRHDGFPAIYRWFNRRWKHVVLSNGRIRGSPRAVSG